jgi:hypothetical protein
VLRIVGASFGRTGTTSARLALERLGFGPCHYMRALFTDEAAAQAWYAAAGDALPDWPRLLAGYRSTIAWPASYFWRELAALYPTAKVLLLTRDPDEWYESVAGTLYRTRPVDGGSAMRDRAVERIVWQGIFGGRFADREHAIAVYRAHLEAVREGVPRARLVEFSPAQGWAPLCSALGVDVPREPFPVANTTGDYVRRAAEAGVLPGGARTAAARGERAS